VIYKVLKINLLFIIPFKKDVLFVAL